MVKSLEHEGPGHYSENIKRYWAKRGHTVETRDFVFGDPYGGFWCVRSDLLNGLPVRKAQ